MGGASGARSLSLTADGLQAPIHQSGAPTPPWRFFQWGVYAAHCAVTQTAACGAGVLYINPFRHTLERTLTDKTTCGVNPHCTLVSSHPCNHHSHCSHSRPLLWSCVLLCLLAWCTWRPNLCQKALQQRVLRDGLNGFPRTAAAPRSSNSPAQSSGNSQCSTSRH